MELEKLKIKVIDKGSGQTLFECTRDESAKAYQAAAEFEEMGLDIEVITPSLTASLSTSLGLSREQTEAFEKSLEEESLAHEGSCCFEENKKIH